MAELKLLSDQKNISFAICSTVFHADWVRIGIKHRCVQFYSPNQNKILELILEVNMESTPGKQILNVNSSSSMMKNSNVQCLSINQCSCIWDGSRKLLLKDALAKLLKEFTKKKEEEREWVQDCKRERHWGGTRHFNTGYITTAWHIAVWRRRKNGGGILWQSETRSCCSYCTSCSDWSTPDTTDRGFVCLFSVLCF